MKHGISISINVQKIEKERLFEGKKGKYLNMTLFVDTDQKDEYGHNGMVTQDVSKEERDQGVKGPILGNCKLFYSKQSGQSQTPPNSHENTQQPGPGPANQQGQPAQYTEQGGNPSGGDFVAGIPF